MEVGAECNILISDPHSLKLSFSVLTEIFTEESQTQQRGLAIVPFEQDLEFES